MLASDINPSSLASVSNSLVIALVSTGNQQPNLKGKK